MQFTADMNRRAVTVGQDQPFIGIIKSDVGTGILFYVMNEILTNIPEPFALNSQSVIHDADL